MDGLRQHHDECAKRHHLVQDRIPVSTSGLLLEDLQQVTIHIILVKKLLLC